MVGVDLVAEEEEFDLVVVDGRVFFPEEEDAYIIKRENKFQTEIKKRNIYFRCNVEGVGFSERRDQSRRRHFRVALCPLTRRGIFPIVITGIFFFSF